MSDKDFDDYKDDDYYDIDDSGEDDSGSGDMKKGEGSVLRVKAVTLFIGASVLVAVTVLITMLTMSAVFEYKQAEQNAKRVVFNNEATDTYKVAKLQDIVDFIEKDFGLEYDINELIEGAIKGLTEALGDRYSYYIEPGDFDDYNEYVTGTYTGVGMTYTVVDDGLQIAIVNNGTPAEKAGIKVGDIITHIDGAGTVDLTEDEIVSKLSVPGISAILTVRGEDGTLRDVTVTVAEINRQSVYTRDEGNGIWYVRITQFDDDTGTEFAEAIAMLQENDAQRLILDLRSNGGGYEREAKKVADLLLGEGLIAYSEDRNGNRIGEISSDADCIDLPLVVLVNGNTASASELVTGALRDHERATIIGVKTFGKALGQVSRSYTLDGSGMVLTIARYYTPSGECIHGVGIEPHVTVELLPEYAGMTIDDLPREQDTQLDKALELIQEQ